MFGLRIWERTYKTWSRAVQTGPNLCLHFFRYLPPETWDPLPLSPVCNPYCKPSAGNTSSNELDKGTFRPNQYKPFCLPSTPSEPDAQIQIYSSVVRKHRQDALRIILIFMNIIVLSKDKYHFESLMTWIQGQEMKNSGGNFVMPKLTVCHLIILFVPFSKLACD